MPPRRKRTHKSDVAVRTVVGLGVPVRKLIRIQDAFNAQGDELPMASRKISRQGLDELFALVAETHTVQLTNGDRFELEFANQHKLLQLVLNENQSVRDVFEKRSPSAHRHNRRLGDASMAWTDVTAATRCTKAEGRFLASHGLSASSAGES